MGTKLISFLGLRDYTPCVYHFGADRARPTKFIQAALLDLKLLGDEP